jgi:hypothetical protein
VFFFSCLGASDVLPFISRADSIYVYDFPPSTLGEEKQTTAHLHSSLDQCSHSNCAAHNMSLFTTNRDFRRTSTEVLVEYIRKLSPSLFRINCVVETFYIRRVGGSNPPENTDIPFASSFFFRLK